MRHCLSVLGSIVTTEQEAQQLTSYISLLLISPIVISLNAIENPHTPLMQILLHSFADTDNDGVAYFS